MKRFFHHDGPKEICTKSYTNLVAQTAVFIPIPITFTILNYITKTCCTPTRLFQHIILGEIVFCIAASLAQITHHLCHRVNHATPAERTTATIRLATLLQRYRIIVNPALHRRHHQTLDSHYPILTGWSSGLVDFIYSVYLRACSLRACSLRAYRDGST